MTRLAWALLLTAVAVPARAEMYSYRDETGKVHVVDQQTAIPPQYRSQAGSTGAGPTAGSVNAVPSDAASPRETSADTGADSSAEAPTGTPNCVLRFIDKPKKVIDQDSERVTYSGAVRNSGNGIARGARAHLKLFSALDGSKVDEQSEVLRPSDVQPGTEATFQITGDFRQKGLRNSARDDLMIDFSRCDSTKRVVELPAGSACQLATVGDPKKTVDIIRKTVTYEGKVANKGSGTAKAVQVVVSMFEIRTGEPLDSAFTVVSPASLGPGEEGSFSIVIPQKFGFRDAKDDKIEVRAARCD